MSGGHFEYKQYDMGMIADSIEQVIIDNDSTAKNEYGDNVGFGYNAEVIALLKTAVAKIREAQVYAQRADWLLSGDDGEDSFIRRLAYDLAGLNTRKQASDD